MEELVVIFKHISEQNIFHWIIKKAFVSKDFFMVINLCY